MKCAICRRPVGSVGGDLCRFCGRAFDRACADQDMITVIRWVAARVRYFTNRGN